MFRERPKHSTKTASLKPEDVADYTQTDKGRLNSSSVGNAVLVFD